MKHICPIFMFVVMLCTCCFAEEKLDKNSQALSGYQSLDSFSAVYQPYLSNTTAYEPMYFLAGTNPEKSKFQVSFKYQLLESDTSDDERYKLAQGFYFAYTQTSFWDLKSASRPFKDTSYKPELFFLSSNFYNSNQGKRAFFLQTGIQHVSNGREENYSRSTNLLYVKPIFIFFDAQSLLGLQIAPKAWVYIENDDDTNPDIDDYKGYFDLELKLGKADSLVLESHFRSAEAGNSIQLDLTYPLRRYVPKSLDVYLQLEYVNALSESLLNYRERTDAFRIGVAIIR